MAYTKGKSLKVSTNFTSVEFDCKGKGCCSSTIIDTKLVNFLQKIRTKFNAPITINSGYRCAKHNKAVGGASASYHTKGMAADIVVKGVEPKEVAKYAESIGVKGIGLYDTFVHIDSRTTKSFWLGHAQTPTSTFGGAPTTGPNPLVKAFQEAAIKDGFKNILKSGADGYWGAECEEVAKKAVLYKTKYPWRLKNLTKFVQGIVGATADGKFGQGTHNLVVNYQVSNGLTADGVVGTKTYKKMVGVK